jgi:UDP-N-acetylglucosamine acyltransferase
VIHPTAIVHPKAQLDSSVEVGPYAVIDEYLQIGTGCVIGPHAYLTGRTAIGPNNRFFAGCVIGEAPQDLKYSGEPTSLIVGQANVFREHVTINRSSNPAGQTVIGSQNYFMANSHVAHDCHIGDFVILANGAAMGGVDHVSQNQQGDQRDRAGQRKVNTRVTVASGMLAYDILNRKTE